MPNAPHNPFQRPPWQSRFRDPAVAEREAEERRAMQDAIRRLDGGFMWQNDAMPQPAAGPRVEVPVDPVDIPEEVMTAPKKKAPWYNQPLHSYVRGMSTKLQPGEVGIEIECEGTHLFNAPISYWSCHNDGSLRATNDHPPVEYVLKKPLPRGEIPAALTYLTSKLKSANSRVNDSHRSSVHVHVNCQQMTLKEIVNYICLYIFFEHALVEFSGQERVGNLFCLRAKDAQFWVRSIVEGFRTGQLTNVFHENFRYTSCNTASLQKFGSLEFRSMRGTVDQELIQSWVDILLLLKDQSLTFSDPLVMYEKFAEGTALDFFSYVFKPKPSLAKLLSTTACLESGLNEGSIFVRDIAYSVEEWSSVMPPKIEAPQPIEAGGMANRPRGAARREDRMVRARRNDWYQSNTREPEGLLREFWLPDQVPQAGVNRQRVVVPYRSRVVYDEIGLICIYNYATDEVTEWFVDA